MQMLRLIRRVETAAKSGLSLEWLRPFMIETRRSAGDILFKRGDYADRLFVLLAGQIHREQIDHVLNAGDLFGEIGLFSTDHQRTQTARAFTDVELLWISESELVQVCYENPGISFYFLRLTTNRLIPMHHARSSTAALQLSD
jgi:CRP/FNR family cyclic AMP-dependent transcriptional regulator